MPSIRKGQLIRLVFRDAVRTEISAFLIDRRARGLSERTVEFYHDELGHWYAWLRAQGITDLLAITPGLLRRWLLHLGQIRNPGGVHANYRALRAFLRWTWEVNDFDARNPIRRVKPPRVSREPLEPLSVADLKAMLGTCDRKTFTGDRDRAILLCLLDTGCRAGEFVALNVGDVNIALGSVLVRSGKGGKPRVTFLGAKSRKELVRYLRHRGIATDDEPLWVRVAGKRLAYGGLRKIVWRRAKRSGVPVPSLHAFRRAFAILSLRSGADIYSLQRLLGHSDLSVLRRYLKQTEDDLREAHEKHGPVDQWL